jgi:hypothetical protein
MVWLAVVVIRWTHGIESLRIAAAMTQDEVRVLVDRYRAAWFGHDLEAIMALVSDDIVFHNVISQERVDGVTAFARTSPGSTTAGRTWPSRSTRSISRPMLESRNGPPEQRHRTGGGSSGTDST